MQRAGQAGEGPHIMGNGIPIVRNRCERLMMPAPLAGDSDGPWAAGLDFLIWIDDKYQCASNDMDNAIMQAETPYRHFAGTVIIRDRITGAMLWSRS